MKLLPLEHEILLNSILIPQVEKFNGKQEAFAIQVHALHQTFPIAW